MSNNKSKLKIQVDATFELKQHHTDFLQAEINDLNKRFLERQDQIDEIYWQRHEFFCRYGYFPGT